MNFKINPVEKLALVLGANEYVKEIAQKTGQQIQPLIPLLVVKVGSGYYTEVARILGETETTTVPLDYCYPEHIVGIPKPNDEGIIIPFDSLIEMFETFGGPNISVDKILEMAGNKGEEAKIKLFEFILSAFTPTGRSDISPSDKYGNLSLEEIIQTMRYRDRRAAERFYLPNWVRYENVIFTGVDKTAESTLAAVLYVILGQEVRGYPLEDKVFVLCAEAPVLRYLERSSRDTYRLLGKHCVVIPFQSDDFAEYMGETLFEDKEVVEFQMGKPPREVENYIKHFVDYLLNEDEVKNKNTEDKISYVSGIVNEIFYYYDEIETIVRQKLFK
jgi:hypothetical protein